MGLGDPEGAKKIGDLRKISKLVDELEAIVLGPGNVDLHAVRRILARLRSELPAR